MKNKILIFLEKHCGAWLIKLLCATCRVQCENQPKDDAPKIFAFWHCNMVPLAYHHKNENKVALVSASKDGQLIAGPLEALGFQTVRGSSGRNSIFALKSLLKSNKSLALAVDGPKGPAYKCKTGVVYLAQKKKIPIICCKVRCSAAWQLSSWDKLKIPKPFSKISICYHHPIYVGSGESIDKKLEIIEKSLLAE